MAFAGSAGAGVPNPWSGSWSRPPGEIGGSSGGVTKLSQQGASVTGSFNWGGGGTVSGTVSGSTLMGTWMGTTSAGEFTLRLGGDARSFTGTWKATSGALEGAGGAWSGTYIGERAVPAPAPTQTEAKPSGFAFAVKLGARPAGGKAALVARGRFTVSGRRAIGPKAARGTLSVAFETQTGKELWRLAIRGPGNYVETPESDLLKWVVKLVVEVTYAAGARRTACAADDIGTLTVGVRPKGQGLAVLDGICGEEAVRFTGVKGRVTLRPGG